MSGVTGGSPIKGYIALIRDGDIEQVLDFQFNPTEVARVRAVDYDFTVPPGGPIALAAFKGIQGDSFTLSLLFDAVETFDSELQGTTAQKAFLESLTQPDFDDFSDDLGSFTPPPRARYGLGEESWDVVVTNLQFRDVRWNRDMVPTRTWAEIQFRSHFVDVATLRARFDRLQSYRDALSWY